MFEFVIILAVTITLIVALDLLFPATATRLALGIERMRCGLSLMHASTPDFDFSYLTGGKGETLVLVHGFGADKDNYTRVANHLTDRFRVIAIDLPGFGEASRLPNAPYSIHDQAGYLHSIVEHLGLDEFHLGGSSMGGAIAIDYAAAHPQRVKSLWLLAPGGIMSANDSQVVAEYRAHGRALLVLENAADMSRLLALVMEKRPFFPSSVKRTLGARGARDAPLHRRIFDEIAASPASEERAGSVATPAFIVWGEVDRVLDVSGAAILHAAMPTSTVRLMDGIGHLPMIEAPRQTARDYIQFVNALEHRPQGAA